MDEEKIIDQTAVAQSVSDKINYTFFDHFLVKPLDPIKVKKEFSKPVPTEPAKEDKFGVEAQDFDNVDTEVKEVDSDYRKGVVIKCPAYYDNTDIKPQASVGDIVIFRDTAGLRFDLLKDSRLLRVYEILGIEK